MVRTFLFFLAGLASGILPGVMGATSDGNSSLSRQPRQAENPPAEMADKSVASQSLQNEKPSQEIRSSDLTIEDMSLVDLLRQRIEMESSLPFEGAATDFHRLSRHDDREDEEWQKANPYLKANPSSSAAVDLDPEGEWWVILKGTVSHWASTDFARNNSETQAQDRFEMDAYLMNRHGKARIRLAGTPVLDRQENRAYFLFSTLGCPDGVDRKVASFLVAAPQKNEDSVRVLIRPQGNPRYTVADVQAKWFDKFVFEGSLQNETPAWGCPE